MKKAYEFLLVLLSIVFFFGVISTVSVVKAAEASLMFSPNVKEVALGEVFEVKVEVDTAGAKTGGVGAKIKYQPSYLDVLEVQSGTIFADYPSLIIDKEKGLITASGVVSSPNDLYSGSGTFVTLSLKSKALGQTTMDFEFTPDNTRDSNIAVTYGNGDILAKVNTLTINTKESTGYQPDEAGIAGGGSAINDKTTSIISSFIEMIRKWVVEKFAKKTTDPYAPLSYQESKTQPIREQPQAKTGYGSSISTKLGSYLPYLLVFVLIITIAIFVAFLIKRKSKESSFVNNLDQEGKKE